MFLKAVDDGGVHVVERLHVFGRDGSERGLLVAWLGHFMLAKRQGRKIWVYDPLKGEALLSLFHFFMIWHKTLILLYVN